MRNDYKVICEKKYYVVFTDGRGKSRRLRFPRKSHRSFRRNKRGRIPFAGPEERHTVSFDAMDCEGDFFASYDSYELDGEKPELSREEKGSRGTESHEAETGGALRLVYLSHYTHERIAAEKGCQDRQLHSKSGRQKRLSKKYLKNFSEKPYNCPCFVGIVRERKFPKRKLKTEYSFHQHITCPELR